MPQIFVGKPENFCSAHTIASRRLGECQDHKTHWRVWAAMPSPRGFITLRLMRARVIAGSCRACGQHRQDDANIGTCRCQHSSVVPLSVRQILDWARFGDVAAIVALGNATGDVEQKHNLQFLQTAIRWAMACRRLSRARGRAILASILDGLRVGGIGALLALRPG